MKKKLLLVLASLVLCLALIEGACRVYFFKVRGWAHFDCDERGQFDYRLTYRQELRLDFRQREVIWHDGLLCVRAFERWTLIG